MARKSPRFFLSPLVRTREQEQKHSSQKGEREETKTHRAGPGAWKKNFLLPRPFDRLFVECSFSFGAFVIVIVVVVVGVGGGGGVPFLFRPSFFTPFFSLVFLKGNNNIARQETGAHTIHFSFSISSFSSSSPSWHKAVSYNSLLLFENNPSNSNNPQKKRKSERARTVECKRSEAKLIRNSSRENFIHTQIEFDIHATRTYQSGSFLFSRVHFIIFGFYAYLVKKQI